jgi:hypothetical protein
MAPVVLRLGLVTALAAGLPHGVWAQVSLTLSQTPNVFPAPALADYNAGMITNPTGIGFSVNVTGGGFALRTTIVSIRASAASLGNGKALSDLEWRRSDLATWNPVTTANVTVESRPVRWFLQNDPWSNTVFLRMRLNWATDAPATYSTGLVFTLTVTTP